MHLPPFHNDSGDGLHLILGLQIRSQNIGGISESIDTNKKKMGGSCYVGIPT